MASMLSSFFSRDPRATFAYELPTEPIVTQRGISVGISFKKAEPTEKATCFWSSERERDSLKTQAQKLRTLRHPNVLVYHDQLETENTFYLVTETCLPLNVYMERTKLTAAQKELFVSWGLYQVLSGLKFLHNEVKISHNALRDSIFVTAAGDWKLAGFEQSRQF
ncbi:SCY1 protein kinase, partial [Aphelenchoides avenae]